MNIQNAIGKRRYEVRGEQAHVSGETNQIYLAFLKSRDDLAVVSFAFETLGGDDARGQAAFLGAVDAGSAFAIAQDDGDFGVGDTSGVDAFRQSDKIRPA